MRPVMLEAFAGCSLTTYPLPLRLEQLSLTDAQAIAGASGR